ncbi:MAG: nucleotide exchange factor GrpE [Mycobacterium sp.]|nr:nucleotide exchange factor GrpE [Mycobacterium sp.]
MTRPSQGDGEPQEPVTVTDKRRIDPETGQVREAASSGPAPSGPGPEGVSGETPEEADKASELLADLQRVQADFTNYRKRAMRDQQAAADRAKAGVVSQLLPVLDDLDRARSHGDLETGPLKSVADKLVAALEGLGLTAFGAVGDPFDPALHEAVQHEGDGSNPVIGTVMRPGFKLGDQVLRHAMVAVVDTVEEADTAVNDGASASQAPESE